MPLLTLLFQSSFGQKELFGEWKVNCPFELADKSSTTVCNLCPIIKKDNGFMVQTFEMKIEKDEIKFNANNLIEAVKYKWNDITKSIEFDYNENNYQFKVLVASYVAKERYILKNKDGMLLLLDEK